MKLIFESLIFRLARSLETSRRLAVFTVLGSLSIFGLFYKTYRDTSVEVSTSLFWLFALYLVFVFWVGFLMFLDNVSIDDKYLARKIRPESNIYLIACVISAAIHISNSVYAIHNLAHTFPLICFTIFLIIVYGLSSFAILIVATEIDFKFSEKFEERLNKKK